MGTEFFPDYMMSFWKTFRIFSNIRIVVTIANEISGQIYVGSPLVKKEIYSC